MSSSPDERIVADRRKAVYDQDCEFLRYQGRFMWSRFQTALALEAVTLYAVFIAAASTSAVEKMAMIFFSGAIVAILFRIALRDAVAAGPHLQRIAQFEREFGAYEPPRWVGPKGYALLRMAMLLVNIANVALLVDFGLKLR